MTPVNWIAMTCERSFGIYQCHCAGSDRTALYWFPTSNMQCNSSPKQLCIVMWSLLKILTCVWLHAEKNAREISQTIWFWKVHMEISEKHHCALLAILLVSLSPSITNEWSWQPESLRNFIAKLGQTVFSQTWISMKTCATWNSLGCASLFHTRCKNQFQC